MTVNWSALCSFCGHPHHGETCPEPIHIGTSKEPKTAPCPCVRHLKKGN